MKKMFFLIGFSIIVPFSFAKSGVYFPEYVHLLIKAEKINQYFSKRNMPLAGLGLDFVMAAEENNLPYNLLPAIAVQESSGGKRCKNNNPFGWGSCEIRFTDYKEAISTVGFKLGNHKFYKDKTLSQKLYTYNPDKSYKVKIFSFMKKIDTQI